MWLMDWSVATKFAETVLFWLAGTVQSPAPLQAPLQPANWKLASAFAVKVTWVSGSNVAEQVEPQSIPEGALVTVPVPPPAGVTVTVNGWLLGGGGGGGGLS